jgi:hypothetical protein
MAIKRRRYGKSGWGYTVDGERVPGVTKILGMLPKDNLIKWAAESTGDYALNNWERLSHVPYADRLKELYRARFEISDPAAKRGTEVHRLAQAIAEAPPDFEVPVPEELHGYVEQYREFLDTMEVAPLRGGTELVIASRTLRYCGTADLVADLGAVSCDGDLIPPGRWLLDLKTSGKGIYPESALQTCAYSRADVFIDPETGEERPVEWLGIEHCGAVWVKHDDWELRPLDTGPEVWEVFKTLRWLYDRQEQDIPLWVSGPAAAAELVSN